MVHKKVKSIWELGKFVRPDAKTAKYIVEHKSRWAFHKPRIVRVGTTTLALAKAEAGMKSYGQVGERRIIKK
jgi:hypothetical protein